MLTFERSQHALRPVGELTIYHAVEARTRLGEELAADLSLALDLSAIEELDTAGVQVLLWLKREAKAQGRAVPFAHHSPAVLDVFDQLNLAGAFGDTLLIAPSA
jgi:anti-anti-sigma factor